MATVATTPRTNRFTLATTSAGPFLVGFRLFASDGLDVHVDGVRQTSGFTVNATFVDGYDDSATVTFVSSLTPGTVIQFDGALDPGRSADYANPDPLLTAKLNVELARLWSSVSEINQLVRRSVRGLDPLEAVDGIDATDLADLPANLAAAALAATTATTAAGQATAALDQVLLIQDTLPDPRGAWLTATAYGRGDIVTQAGSSYICLISHTSGVFATDLSAARWQLLAEKGAAGAGTGDMLGSNNLSELTNKPLALATLQGQPSDPLLTDIAALVDPGADRILFWDDSEGEMAWLTPGSGLEVVGGTMNATAVPAGAIMAFAAKSPPAGWLKCDGTAVSRSTYSTLFNAICPELGNFTVTIASPAIFTLNGHGLQNGDPIRLSTTGALPTGVNATTTYFVRDVTTNTFRLAATAGGAAINTTGSQSGTHSARYFPHGAGDGSTTFTLPDRRGGFIRGWDDGRGIDVGRVFGSDQLDQMQRIVGDFGAGRWETVYESGPFAVIGNFTSRMGDGTGVSGSVTRFDTASAAAIAAGLRAGTETRPRNSADLICIKF